MKTITYALPLFAICLSACTSSAPNCTADETKNLVLNIAMENKLLQSWREPYLKGSISLDGISTKSNDSKTGKYECAGEVKFYPNSEVREKLLTLNKDGSTKKATSETVLKWPVEYISELSGKSDEFRVAVTFLDEDTKK